MIGNILGSIYDFFANLIGATLGWFANLFGYLFQKLFDFLKLLLSPVLILIAIVFYLLYKVGVLVVLLLQVLLGIGKIFVALIKGIIATMVGFNYTPTTRNDGQWTSIFSHLADGFDYFQFDTIAYILLFLVWFSTAFAAVRIISTMASSSGGGGE